MKADNRSTPHNRTIALTDLPGDQLKELSIRVDYTREENDGSVISKAVTLDHVVIPEIVRRLTDPEPIPPKSLATLANEALEVQDACNLSGVVHAWSRSIHRLRELLPDAGTAGINGHPINVLWASKVGSLTRCEYDTVFSVAYDACRELAKG